MAKPFLENYIQMPNIFVPYAHLPMKKIIKRPLKYFQKQFDLKVGSQTIPDGKFYFDNSGDQKSVQSEIGEGCYINDSGFIEREIGEVIIGDRIYIGGGTSVICVSNVKLGSDVLLAWVLPPLIKEAK